MNTVSKRSAEHYTWGTGCDGWFLSRNEYANIIQERMPPQTAEVLHFHKRSHQFFFVLAGTLSLTVDGTLHKIGPEEALEIPPTVQHRVSNDGEIDVHFLVISVPPSHGHRVVISDG